MDEFRIFFVFYRESNRHNRYQHVAGPAYGTFVLQKRKVQNKYGLI
jgi:hypothetical protein